MLRNPKHFYLFGVMVNTLGTIAIITFWRNESNAHQYLSHVATSSIVSYFILLISLLLQMIFTYFFVRRFFFELVHANRLFRLNYYAVLVSFLLVAVFPMVAGLSGEIHALSSSLSVLVSTCIYIQLCLNKTISLKIRLFIALMVITGFSLHWVFSAIFWQLSMVMFGELSILLITYKNKAVTS
jgi:hypothetical protein